MSTQNQPTEYKNAGDNSEDGTVYAKSDGKVGFYGITPIVVRTYTSAVHLSSEITSSASFGATQTAALHEVMKTFIALGVWATA